MDSELPGYSESPSFPVAAAGSTSSESRHTVTSLQDSQGFKWLKLTVNSRATASIPVVYEGDVISGQVGLDVLKSESIKGISVQVFAGTTLVGQEEQPFLDITTDLWTPFMSLPDGSKVTGFTQGRYTWPFSFIIPTEVEMQDKKIRKKFRLPTTFCEKASTAYLDYKLIVTVKRGLLKPDRTLMTSFVYVPVTRPLELPSPILQNSYRQNLPLVGPEGTLCAITSNPFFNLCVGDPEGWHPLPPLTVQGKLFNSHTVEVMLTLALAKPLTYARGTPVPLWLTLAGNDEQALDLLSTPKAIKLLLVRSLATGSDATSDTEHRTNNYFFENVARAVFWAPEYHRGQGQRILQGEVDVGKSLKPSTLFPRFTISYQLDLQPFEVAGFVATAPKNTPLLRQRVTIVNFPALHFPIRSLAPPEYVRDQGADYNRSFGLLENGNQRFYHHGS